MIKIKAQKIRESILDKRKKLSCEQQAKLSFQIQKNLENFLVQKKIIKKTTSIFIYYATQNEVATLP